MAGVGVAGVGVAGVGVAGAGVADDDPASSSRTTVTSAVNTALVWSSPSMPPASSVDTTLVMRESPSNKYPSGMLPGDAIAAESASITSV